MVYTQRIVQVRDVREGDRMAVFHAPPEPHRHEHHFGSMPKPDEGLTLHEVTYDLETNESRWRSDRARCFAIGVGSKPQYGARREDGKYEPLLWLEFEAEDELVVVWRAA